MSGQREREAIVAWLHKEADRFSALADTTTWLTKTLLQTDAELVDRLADAIERGDHLKAPTNEG